MDNTKNSKEPEETKSLPHVEESKILRRIRLTEKDSNEHYLQRFHLIWFDPNIDSAENKELRENIDKLFKMKNYIISREALEAALKAVQDIPIIVISCGEKYEEIGELVENSSQVIMIAIFCSNLELHLSKLTHHIKIAAVIDKLSNLEKVLRKGLKSYVRYSKKFLDEAEENTFYELKDQQKILDGQGMKGVFFEDESNITYPLYYKGFHFEEKAWQDSLKRILLASSNHNLCHVEDRKYLIQRIEELSTDRSPQSIIHAYTNDGLHPMFNRAFRMELLDLFRLFGFVLRGSMGLLGGFIDSGETLFRGLDLKAEHMKRWEDNLGNIVLLNGYTSTSLNRALCVTGEFGGNCLMEFRFTKEVQIFEDSLKVFNKLWSGYYSPVDIQKLSAFPREKEILFPPFYPIRIQKITPPDLHPDGIFHIVLLAPTYINIGEGGQWTPKFGDKMTEEMAISYVERLTILVQNEQMTKVDLNWILYNCKGKEREGIFRALGDNIHVQYLNLFHTNTRIGELGMLFPLNSLQKAWKYLDLGENYFGDEGAKIVALNLKSLPHLEVLELWWNDIGDEGTKYLATNLKLVPKLWRLDLLSNKIGDEGVDSLIQHLECVPSMKYLDLNGNDQISKGMKKKMKEFAQEKGINVQYSQY